MWFFYGGRRFHSQEMILYGALDGYFCRHHLAACDKKLSLCKSPKLTKYPVLGYLMVLEDSPFQNIFEAV